MTCKLFSCFTSKLQKKFKSNTQSTSPLYGPWMEPWPVLRSYGFNPVAKFSDFCLILNFNLLGVTHMALNSILEMLLLGDLRKLDHIGTFLRPTSKGWLLSHSPFWQVWDIFWNAKDRIKIKPSQFFALSHDMDHAKSEGSYTPRSLLFIVVTSFTTMNKTLFNAVCDFWRPFTNLMLW